MLRGKSHKSYKEASIKAYLLSQGLTIHKLKTTIALAVHTIVHIKNKSNFSVLYFLSFFEAFWIKINWKVLDE